MTRQPEHPAPGRADFPRALVVCLAVLLAGCQRGPLPVTETSSLAVTATTNAAAVPRYSVFELSFLHDREYANPWLNVDIEVTLTSPSGKRVKVGGFHHGSATPATIKVVKTDGPDKTAEYVFDRHNLWKARYAPAELGTWTYAWRFANTDRESAAGEGSFRCVDSPDPRPGFLRIDPGNPFRLVHDDGSPFYPVGLQDCLMDNSATGTVLNTMAMEGPFSTSRTGALPPGPLYVRGPPSYPMNADVYFRTFAAAGFNIFRFSQDNCSFDLYEDLLTYLPQQAIMIDELLATARKYGFRIMYGLFGYQQIQDPPSDARWTKLYQRFIEYSVNRWGAYVDVWELLNEQEAGTAWYGTMTPVLKSADPYRHPVTTSWERPAISTIDINAPHWYEGENELVSDSALLSAAWAWKQFDKPVILGEQGNVAGEDSARWPGLRGLWDSASATRMRLRLWTAMFDEIGTIFWNTSYARDSHTQNIWLGPQERQYVRALQDFSYRLGGGLRMVNPEVSPDAEVRAYGLASDRSFGAWLHHFASHDTLLRGASITVELPAAGTGYWYSPENAHLVGQIPLEAGRQVLEVPPFRIDLALLVTPGGPPDIDGDGLPNDVDRDNDNDGVADLIDAFPLDPSEWKDSDGDLIGDSFDMDDNGDGIADDLDGDGTPDFQQLDFDRDGVDRGRAVPWDAFPFDRREWRDTDGDGIGDNADLDDDGDGFSDARERQAGTDPLNPLSFPLA